MLGVLYLHDEMTNLFNIPAGHVWSKAGCNGACKHAGMHAGMHAAFVGNLGSRVRACLHTELHLAKVNIVFLNVNWTNRI